MDTTETSHLLVLTHSRPAEALSRARDLLARRPAAAEASIAHQAAGIALRDLGDLDEGLAELRRALRSARASGDQQREADVRATLGLSTGMAGDTTRGLAHLGQAVRLAHGAQAGRVLMRRANLLLWAGRRQEALRDQNEAVALLRRHGDTHWEARARMNRGLILLEMGQTRQAEADFHHAERQYAELGLEWDLAIARHNQGLVAAASGRVPQALELLAEANQCYGRLGTPMPDVAIDRCAALLSAGLAADAYAETDDAINRDTRADIRRSAKFAEMLYSAATAALAAGDPRAATERAEQAARLFARQQRERWSARTRLVLVQARQAAGDTSLSTYRLACSVARQLDALGAEEAPEAHLLAGRLALLRRNRAATRAHLAAAARRRTGPAVGQSRAWLARALLAQVEGHQAQMLAACRRGLAVVAECQQMLGASELRAAVTAHGGELAAIGQRAALNRADPRRLLEWSERWRATTQAIPPARPPRDELLAQDMSALREVSRLLEHDLAAPAQEVALRRERTRLERAVRDRILRTPGSDGASGGQARFSLPALRAALARGVLIELVELDGTLHAVTVSRSGLRLHTVGAAARASREAVFARSQLQRMASRRRVPDEARQLLDQAGGLLEQALLGPAAADLGDAGLSDADPVVIVPPGGLEAIPWGLLPALRDRAVSVSPSATAWLRARSAAAPGHRRVMLAHGPGLPHADAEIKGVGELHPQAVTLTGGCATADRVLAALDGAWLAHIAAHGTFRSDNPLFSDLRLEDGPLTVYDIEGIPAAPWLLVLSACDSGRAAAVGADELLGVASSILAKGTTGIVAAIVAVNDEATGPVMTSLHEAVAAGAGFPRALRAARQAAASPLELATACSFVALGA
ncbi:MAG TPA: CHAT domain-containing tetratricopeptide repeat protein [Trebonia sp.]|nr:CHAT domain-containing tetratricopeptide repeat protein [Trebonia sp.]